MRVGRMLAAAQTVALRGDVDANVAQHLRLAELAAGAGARVVVYPELSLTGYELDIAAELAFSEVDDRLDPLRDAARSLGVTLVAGAPVRLGAALHIGAFIASPDGGIDLYTKRYLGAFSPDVNPGGTVPPPEATVFEPGDRDPLVRAGAATAAVAVCADIGRAAHAEAAAARGVDTYLASMFVIPDDLEGDSAKLRHYASEHGLAVVLANHGAPTGGLGSAGCSTIWSASGDVIVRLPPSGAGVAVALEHDGAWRAQARMLG